MTGEPTICVKCKRYEGFIGWERGDGVDHRCKMLNQFSFVTGEHDRSWVACVDKNVKGRCVDFVAKQEDE